MNHQAVSVYRGKYLESTHNVHIAVVNSKGELVAYLGDPNRKTFARSSMKPFQSIPVVESGAMKHFNITKRELSLFCASHIGEDYHRKTVQEVLEKIGLQEKHLQCGTHIPRHLESYHQLIKEGRSLTPLFSNCSGKHSGMLTGIVMQNMDIHTYREQKHPYQQQILNTIANIANYHHEKIEIAVDGCGVPVHRLPLQRIALLFSRLARPDKWEYGSNECKDALTKVRDAMVTYPEMVAGTEQFDTELMKAFDKRIVAKGGAEGVHCFGDQKTGFGVAIKVDDGNARGASVSTMEVLRQLNIADEGIVEKLATYHQAPVLNARKEEIGKIIPNFTLKFF